MLLYQRQAQKFAYATRQISRLLKKPPQYGLNAIGIDRLSDSEPRYIRITDIDEFGRLKSTIGKTADDDSRHLYMLGHDDILLARSGTVGKCYIHKAHSLPYPCFYAGYMIKFVVDKEKINPDYFFYYTQLKPFADWVSAVQRVAAQPNINAQEYKSLEIPVPPFANQSKIIEAMGNAYKNMAGKEKEAGAMVGGINDYLSKELEIIMGKKEGTLKNRVFIRYRWDINNRRYDPFFYADEFVSLHRALGQCRYETVRLGDCLSFIESGARPIGGVANIESGVLSLGGEHVSDEAGIETRHHPKFVPWEFHQQNLRTETRKNDIVLVKDGATTGKTGMILKDEHVGQNVNEHVFILRPSSKCVAGYLLNFLCSSFGQKLLEREITGGTVMGVSKSSLLRIPIPLPPPEKQEEIAHHINQMRQHAEKLKEQARSELEDAKRYVEKIILGDGE